MPGNMGYGLFFEPINVRLGSKPDIQREPRNVRCWGVSGSRFRAPVGLLVATSGSPAWASECLVLGEERKSI